MKLMMIPVDNYNDISTLLKLSHYSGLIDYFDYDARRTLSLYVVSNALETGHHLSDTDQVRQLTVSPCNSSFMLNG